MKPRWCIRCKEYLESWFVTRIGNHKVKTCGACRTPTKARKPKPPKHQSQQRKWSAKVKERDGGICRACQEPGNDGAHIFSRGAHPGMRDDVANGVYLCRRDHDYFGSHPVAWRAWLLANVPELYAQLSQEAR